MSEQSAEADGITNDEDDIEIDVDQRVDDGYSEEDKVSDDDAEQIEQERQERLDPENRPINAEVDNTQREFDPEAGEFQVPAEEVENGPQPLSEEDRAPETDGTETDGSDDVG